jgi:predicted SAM-dependent methyltransferase
MSSKNIFFHIENNHILGGNIEFDNINNIKLYSNESIDKIYLQDLLDFYPQNSIIPLLEEVKEKNKPKGLLSIQSIDLKQLSIAIAFGEIDSELGKNILYPNRKNIHTMHEIENVLKDIGYKLITKKYVNIFEYHILAQK